MVLIVVLAGVLSLSTVLLAWYFAGYPLVMGLVALLNETPEPHSGSKPFVSVIIPTYNERYVIAERVRNLLELAYPSDRYEVIFVDSASDDGTVDVLQDELEGIEEPVMRVLEEPERRGKASAINVAMETAVGDIVLVSDANTQFETDILDYIVPHFEDEEVGAVAGSLRIPKEETGLAVSNQFYRELEQMKGMGESRLDSVCQFPGEISAWRKELAGANTTSLSEDLDLSIRIRRQGYKIRYEPRAIAYEPDPNTAQELITSNKRRLIGAIQAMVTHRQFLTVPADSYRALIFPSRKVLQLVSPFLFIVAIGSVIGLLGRRAFSILGWFLAAAVCGTVTVGGALIAVKNRLMPGRASLGLSLGSVVGIVKYLSIMEYTILLAWKDYLIGDYSVLWQKSQSDRQAMDDDETDETSAD